MAKLRFWAERDRYREALTMIVDADPVNLELDPTWPQHIARLALAKNQGRRVKVPVHHPRATWGMELKENQDGEKVLMLVLKTTYGETMTIEADMAEGYLAPHDAESAELLARYFGDD
jgi:hypothetical protein